MRVQVKTSRFSQVPGRFAVQLCTYGGNRSWTGEVKGFGAHRCDVLFVCVGDGRRWLIPATAVDGRKAIVLGGPKYSEFEVEQEAASAWIFDPSLDSSDPRGGAVAGETGQPVKLVAKPEWVRIPPPPSAPAAAVEGSIEASAAGRTTISPGHQMTIPIGCFRAAGLSSGDRLGVEALGDGEVRLTRIHSAHKR